VSKTDNHQGQKTALILITAILITGNVLLLVKSLTPLSLSCLPLVMIGCFLTALIIFRIQQYCKKNDHRLQLGFDVILSTPTNENCTTNYNWEDNARSSHIESIQIFIGLLGLAVISFELMYDKGLTNTMFKMFKVEAPQLAHHFCILLQIFTALFIVGCFIVKNRISININFKNLMFFQKFRKRNHSNNNIALNETIRPNNQPLLFVVLPDNDHLSCDDSCIEIHRRPSYFDLKPSKSFMERINHNTDYDSPYDTTIQSS
jgi:hypothetical protein